jgi:broad specificity phosphatase PhoE
MKTTILFIRHGEVANPRGVIYGRLPRFGLSALGRRQAAAAAEALAKSTRSITSHRPMALDTPRTIFSSPMLRARQTAQIIANQFPELNTQISRRLNEVSSPYEGGPVAMIERSHWDIYEGIPANYERPGDVLTRMLKFTAAVRRNFPGECVLAVSHGDLIYFLTLWAMGQTLTSKKEQTFYPAHASLSSFIFEGDESGKPEYSYFRPEVKV